MRAVKRRAGNAVLATEVAVRMDARLDLMKIDPRRLLDAGCGTGIALPALRERYPHCRIIGIDNVEAELALAGTVATRTGWLIRMLKTLGAIPNRAPTTMAGELDRLPLNADSVDLVWSNLALHRYADPLPVFREMHRVLREEGLLMFSTLGPDTLDALRRAFAEADPGHAHVHDFIDMHDLGDMLIMSGFAAPVMDVETITLTYDNIIDLARDLRDMGLANSLQSRRRGLSGRAMWGRLSTALEKSRTQGRLPASFEIVYGHAWKPQPRQPLEAGPQVVKFHPSADLMR